MASWNVGKYRVSVDPAVAAQRMVLTIIALVLQFFVGSLLFEALIPANGTGMINGQLTTDMFYQGYRILGLASPGGVRTTGIIQIIGILLPIGLLASAFKVSRSQMN